MARSRIGCSCFGRNEAAFAASDFGVTPDRAVCPVSQPEFAVIFIALNRKEKRLNIVNSIKHRLTEEGGDVPGWVLITLMTAGLVVGVWSVAAPALSNLMDDSLSRISVI